MTKKSGFLSYVLPEVVEAAGELTASGGDNGVGIAVATGLDASVTPLAMKDRTSRDWEVRTDTIPAGDEDVLDTRYTIRTPSGELTFRTRRDPFTTYRTEHIAKSFDDAEIFLRHWPGQELDHTEVGRWYDRTADAGIVRGFVSFWGQPGSWQDFVELFGTESAIFLALDEPEKVHAILQKITDFKVRFVHEQMRRAKYDLIEHGGGAASSTVISPTLFEEFCVPYDRQVIDALHDCGFPVVYHTCGGMMAILDKIPLNGCDASETLSPPGVGGDIHRGDRTTVKKLLGSRVGLIGGLDQFHILTDGTPAQVREKTCELFAHFGQNGGYICSASDHFFEAPVENIKALADAALDCTY